MAEFTMELNDEQKEVRDWLHGFAADVIRPRPPNGTSVRRLPGRSSRRPRR